MRGRPSCPHAALSMSSAEAKRDHDVIMSDCLQSPVPSPRSSTMPAPAPMPRPSIQGAMLSFFVVLLYRMYVFAQSLPPLLVNKSRHASAESEIFFKRGSVPFRDATGRPQGRSERRKTADRVRQCSPAVRLCERAGSMHIMSVTVLSDRRFDPSYLAGRCSRDSSCVPACPCLRCTRFSCTIEPAPPPTPSLTAT